MSLLEKLGLRKACYFRHEFMYAIICTVLISAIGTAKKEPQGYPVPSSGPQGQARPFTILDDPCAWKTADLDEKDVIHVLSPEEVADLRSALAHFNASGLERKTITKESFPLTVMADKIAELYEELRFGIGFGILRGVPVDDANSPDALTLDLGISSHFGTLGTNDLKGTLVTHVKKEEAQVIAKNMRPRGSSQDHKFGFHTDFAADVLGLMCLRQAPVGGMSSIASMAAVHNEILRRGRPDILHALTDGNWVRDVALMYPEGVSPPRGERFVRVPIVCYHGGYFYASFGPQNYGKLGAPPLTDLEKEALEMIEEIAGSDEFRLDFMLQPGDFMVCFNSTILHARSEFKDSEDQRRHLLRTWIGLPRGDRPQPPFLTDYTNQTLPDVSPGLFTCPETMLRSGSSGFPGGPRRDSFKGFSGPTRKSFALKGISKLGAVVE